MKTFPVVVSVVVFALYTLTPDNLRVENSSATYEKHALPIFKNRCSTCHNSSWPGKNWTNYDDAFANKDKIKQRVWVERSMPVGGVITEEERKVLKDWVDGGAKK